MQLQKHLQQNKVKRQHKDKGINLISPPKVKHGSAHMQLDFSKITPDGKIAQEEQSTDYLLKLTSAKQECIAKANEFLKLAMLPCYATNVHKTLDHLGYTMLEPEDEKQSGLASNSFFAIFGKATFIRQKCSYWSSSRWLTERIDWLYWWQWIQVHMGKDL